MTCFSVVPAQFGVCPASRQRDENQQDDVVDQDQTDRKEESPEHRLPKVKLFGLIQSCQPAARRQITGTWSQ